MSSLSYQSAIFYCGYYDVVHTLQCHSLFLCDLSYHNYNSCVQEVDGESLLSLDPEMMVKLMGLKTGPALRIYRKINDLKKQFGAANSSDS